MTTAPAGWGASGTGGHPWLMPVRGDTPFPSPAPFPDGWPTPTEPDGALIAEAYMLRAIQAFDRALAEHTRDRPQSVINRLWRGVSDHFRARFGEWIATALLLQFGWILYFPPAVFPTSPNFSVLAATATEETWGAICLAVGSLHLAALTVNGTFPRFRWSPHLRAISSMVGFFLWFQIVLAIWQSGVGGTGLGTYRIAGVVEVFNFIFAMMDTGAVERRRKADYGR